MKKINKTIAILSLGLFTTGFCGCNDELATEDAQKVSSETVLSSTTGLNMVLNSTYKCLLLGDNGSGSQNDACYAGLAGLPMHYDLAKLQLFLQWWKTDSFPAISDNCH